MTLLIGTVSNQHAVITADGLSLPNPVTGAGVASQSYTKIFPVDGLPIVLAHHGLNMLGGRHVAQFIQDYVLANDRVLRCCDIGEIAENLRSYSERDALDVLKEPTNKGVVGFWIVGFDQRRHRPQLYEICWPSRPEPFLAQEPLFIGGHGRDFLDPRPELPSFQYARLPKYPVGFAVQYHQALYRYAESSQRKSGKTVFGGQQHQLFLEKSGWRWAKPPGSAG